MCHKYILRGDKLAKRQSRKRGGWAYTKRYPHKNHPARYRYTKNNNDDIEYITFTHSEQVVIIDEKGKKTIVDTIPLNDNISPSERKKKGDNSYVFPYLYEGKRHSLGEETKDFNLTEKDKSWVDFLFDFLGLFGKKKVNYSSNSNKKKNKKK